MKRAFQLCARSLAVLPLALAVATALPGCQQARSLARAGSQAYKIASAPVAGLTDLTREVITGAATTATREGIKSAARSAKAAEAKKKAPLAAVKKNKKKVAEESPRRDQLTHLERD